jgi:hypothetical protein
MPHINYGNVFFSTVDSASQRRLNVAFNSCLRYVHDIPRWEHVSHLASTIFGVSLATHATHERALGKSEKEIILQFIPPLKMNIGNL